MTEALNRVNIEQIMIESVMQLKDEFIQLQKEQLSEGARSDDAYIYNLETGKDSYSPGYARYKGKTFPIDLHDTGDFYNGINIEQISEGFNIYSNDEKSEMLQKTYSPKIFGLGSKAYDEFKLVLQPATTENLISILNEAV